MKRLIQSFTHGFAGLRAVAAVEANMKLHVLASLGVVAAGFGLRVSAPEWAILIGCMGSVIALECVNTSIERLADRVTREHDQAIKQVKDAAAAGVLVMALAAATIGLIIFLPRIFAFWN